MGWMQGSIYGDGIEQGKAMVVVWMDIGKEKEGGRSSIMSTGEVGKWHLIT